MLVNAEVDAGAVKVSNRSLDLQVDHLLNEAGVSIR